MIDQPSAEPTGPAGPTGPADHTGLAGGTGLDRAVVALPDGTVLLDDFTLLARPGELLVVLGPSGCGKSTLLRAVAGLQPVRAGRVLIQGRDVTRFAPPDRDVAMVFERTTLLPTLDVARNMGFGLAQRQTAAAEVEQRVDRQAQRLGIWGLLRRKPTEISMGQQGQAGIGRALVRVPKVFLLDEPLAHLDLVERARMRRIIAETVKSSGVAALYVTHDQTEAMAIGDRIAVIDGGRLQQLGSSSDLYDRPVNLFVADFVGQAPIGIVPAQVVVSGGLVGFRVGDRTLMTWQPLPDELAGSVGSLVTLGLRPESVTAVPPDPDPDATVLTGRVQGVERTGRDTFLTVEMPTGRLIGRFDGRSRVRVGEVIGLSVDTAAAHVFDVATGRALHHPG
ncbi:ABC transporter ATP-binding protein [Nakamurella sp.]|uniref:ABC transporter ATP-binding protein n=1 Tax=Nakamurella sp. TaxID=1869182 RepID=UPI003783FE12